MKIEIPVGDMPTTTAKLLTALEGIVVTVRGTDDTVVDVQVIRGVETEVGYDTNLLCHPWRETGPGTAGDPDWDTTLIIPCALIDTLEVL